MPESISFLAALAGQSSAARWLSVSSEGDAKVVLEVPASELGQVLRLATAGGKLLRVTVSEE